MTFNPFNLLANFRWYRRWRGGKWDRVSSCSGLWEKCWFRATCECVERVEEDYCRPGGLDVSAMPSLTELLLLGGTTDEITVRKAADVIAHRNYEPSGIVLVHPETGERCIVEMGCVRWMSKADAWTLMHGPG